MPNNTNHRAIYYRLLLVLPLLSLLVGASINRHDLADMGKWSSDARSLQCRAMAIANSISSGDDAAADKLLAEATAKSDALRSVRPKIVEVDEIARGRQLLVQAHDDKCSESAVEASRYWGKIAKRVSEAQRRGIAGSLSWLQLAIGLTYTVVFLIWAGARKK